MKHTITTSLKLKTKKNHPKLFAEFLTYSSSLHERLFVIEQLFAKKIVSIVLTNKETQSY